MKSAEKQNEPGLEQTEKFSAKNVGKQNEKELEWIDKATRKRNTMGKRTPVKNNDMMTEGEDYFFVTAGVVKILS